MIKAYFNLPKTHVMVHRDMGCGHINRQRGQATRRDVLITLANLTSELARFVNREHRFAAEAGLNGMWITLDLNDFDFEIAVVDYIRRILAKRYTPFASVIPQIDC